MATMEDFLTEQELQQRDSLVYQAKQYGRMALANRSMLPGHPSYEQSLFDEADEWFEQHWQASFTLRESQLFQNARNITSRRESELAAQRHVQRLNPSLSASTRPAGMRFESANSNSGYNQGAPSMSAQRPAASGIYTRGSAQPTNMAVTVEAGLPSSVRGVMSKSLPEAGRMQKFTPMPLPQPGHLRPSVALAGNQSTAIGRTSEKLPARDPFPPGQDPGNGSAATPSSAEATPALSRQTFDTYLSLYADAVIGDRIEEAEGILRDVESEHSPENAQWVCVRTYQTLKRAVTGMERHAAFLVAEGITEHGDAVSGPDTLQPTEAMTSGRGKDPKRKRSAGATPSEFRGRVPQYPWGSAWSFQCLKCGPEFRRRDKHGFDQHMRDVHKHRNFVVVDVHDGVRTWEGIRDTTKEEDEIYGEMVFDEAYYLRYPGTGSKPPDAADAAYRSSNGVDLKVKDREKETERKKAERKASKQGRTPTGASRRILPKGDATAAHHVGTDEQAEEPDKETDGRSVEGDVLGRHYGIGEDSPDTNEPGASGEEI